VIILTEFDFNYYQFYFQSRLKQQEERCQHLQAALKQQQRHSRKILEGKFFILPCPYPSDYKSLLRKAQVVREQNQYQIYTINIKYIQINILALTEH